ncbi:hypothetical protein PENTCL1PPCAC_1426 [Pristionchus entomophagus]|uniref:Secreted protein n=1 Tax=Pristionchus entomophagus TaxID=358040 RepID=A0AAV5SHZ0_9BILA|nr:hypothetical protein PENTCL1PPCAC_1426 [Pristionchus entomophagus]
MKSIDNLVRPAAFATVLLLHRSERLTLKVGVGRVMGGVDGSLLSGDEALSSSLLVEFLGDHGLVLDLLLAVLQHALQIVGGVAGLVLGAVEHMFLIADAVLLGLVPARELGRVLELLQTTVLLNVSDRARIGWLAVGRQHVVRLHLRSVLVLSVLGELLVSLSSSSRHVLGAELEWASGQRLCVPGRQTAEQVGVPERDPVLAQIELRPRGADEAED